MPSNADSPPPSGPSRRAVLLGAVGVGVVAGGVASGGILLARGTATAGTPAASRRPTPSPKPTPLTVATLLAEHPFRIAHRGGSDDWPEMSAHAYRRALARGYRALEISVARSSDGVWFGLHDATLDRTSGTSGFVAAEHTWSEISALRISAAGTRNPAQPARPYLRLDAFLAEFASEAVVFLDPKAAQGRFYTELLEQVRGQVREAPNRVVAKSAGSNTAWASLAAQAGFTTWGFYYGADVDSGELRRTAGDWDLLGMDVNASDAAWAAARTPGKPVLAHVLHTGAEDARARALGAAGEIVADVLAIAP